MSLNAISYPYPVLGNSDDISGGVMEPDIGYTITDEAIQLRVTNLRTGHTGIDTLVTDNHALWQIRVKCSRTYMRENFVTQGPDWSINLIGPEYEGSVKIETRVIAVVDIPSYSPLNSHSDYDGVNFQIKSGEMLAIGPDFSFHVDKVYDPLKAPVASLLKVEEGDHNTGPYQLILDDDFILVRLSKADWLEYPGIRDRVPALLHSTIVMPAIAAAIPEMEKNQSTLWAGRLKAIIEEKNINIDHPLMTAQELLNSPLKRTFDEVNAKLDKGEY